MGFAKSTCVIPSCEIVGDFLPVYDNCDEYRVCLEGLIPSDAVLTCPDGEKFINGGCATQPDGYRCEPSCVPASCDTECVDGQVGALVPISGNCFSYNICLSGGETTNVSCSAETPYFDSVAGECSSSPANCCDNDFFYCSSAFVQIADPTDCRRYYLCLVVGIPEEEDLFECPTGEEFDGSTCVPEGNGSC